MPHSLLRLLVWMLAVCLPLQGLVIACERAAGPAHVHVAGSTGQAGHDDGHDRNGDDDEHHHHHDGSAVGYHAHAAEQPGVVYLTDDADADGDAPAPTAPKRLLAVLESLMPLRFDSGAVAAPPPSAPAGDGAFCSNVVEPPERPPRRLG